MKITLKESNKLKVALIQKGYSQRQFARKIDVSEAYLHQIINNKKSPGPTVAKKITDVLDLDFYDIFTIK